MLSLGSVIYVYATVAPFLFTPPHSSVESSHNAESINVFMLYGNADSISVFVVRVFSFSLVRKRCHDAAESDAIRYFV